MFLRTLVTLTHGSVSDRPRAKALRSFHDKSEADRSPATGLRSVRQRATEPRLGPPESGVSKESAAGVRIGNWPTPEEGRGLQSGIGNASLRELRDYAMLALLTGCGLRRAEAAALRIEDLQLREGPLGDANLNGKGGHIRTVPMPKWVKIAIDQWTSPASIVSGTLFRSINKASRVWGMGFTPKVIWSIVKKAAPKRSLGSRAP